MPPKPKQYVIDADILMQAARTYYSFSIARPFWDKLIEYGRQGKIVSIDKVLGEINKGKDDLRTWANKEFKSFFTKTKSDEIYRKYSEIIIWANSQTQYTQIAKNELMEEDNADAWIVAYAMQYNCIVTTSEKSRPKSESKIFIPDICNAFTIECKDIFDMIGELGFTFNS